MSRGTAHAAEDALLELALGGLGERERAELREHLAVCPACEERLRRIAADRARFACRPAPRIDADGKVFLPTVVPARRRPGRRLFVGAGLVAAAAAAAWLLLLPARPPVSPLSPVWLEAPGERVFLRDDPERALGAELEAALRTYEQDPAEAARRLGAIRAEGEAEHLRRIYLASALARLERWEEVVETLEGVPLDTLPEPWGPESRWTLAASLDRIGRSADAESILRELAAEPGPTAERARRALARR